VVSVAKQSFEPIEDSESAASSPAIKVASVSVRFGKKEALKKVSLGVERGEVHALLGPNGAGKTTLLRVLTGLVAPGEGDVALLGKNRPRSMTREFGGIFGLVPSGDRTFYLRISGLENLVFFGRLHGLSRKRAVERAMARLEAVGLREDARNRVGIYSHGMQKRLSVARALLTDPPILLVDEATHDLDPEGAQRVRDLVALAARDGAAVLWTTQRVDEIRAFADRVTLLDVGKVRFQGTVPQLMALSLRRRYLLHMRNGKENGADVLSVARQAVADTGSVVPSDETDGEHFVLALNKGAILGDAVGSLAAAGVEVIGCREERSEIEEAFLSLTYKDRP
jgi:ABC-2 type transport system ATP-binding protein